MEILLSSSVESEPLCEVANPQPLVVDRGTAETVIPRTWFLKHKTVASEGSKARCVLHDGGRQHCGKPRRENADQVNSRWPQLRKVTFRVANVNKALGVSLEDGEEWKHSVVRHVGFIQQDGERHAVAPRKRWSTRCVHADSTARMRTEE